MTRTTRADWSASARFRFGVGIEDTFVAHEAPGRRRLDEYELTQHYQFWERDLDLVAAAGADMLRWGIPWYRVELAPGVRRWDWVDRVVDRMDALGLTCVVDLMHYGTPLWMENAFLHPDYPHRVAEYAAAAAERYGDRLHVWTPLNEPVVNAVFCGERGLWPPYLHGQSGFVQVLAQLAEGIVRTQEAIRAVQGDASFVHVDAGFRFEGDRPGEVDRRLLEHRRFLAQDLVMGRVDDSHPLHDWLLAHGASEARLSFLREHPAVPDVLGVNYYPAFTTVRLGDGPDEPVEAGTAGLEDLVRLYHQRYGLPLAITETSRGGPLDGRRQWLDDSLTTVRRLREQGVPLVGYTWFPFIALVDWLYREDTGPVEDWLVQMGLVDLVPLAGSAVLERHPTELVDRFRAAVDEGMPAVVAASGGLR
jgi:beta-glucosidase/6-phospho-beta-glucosidase/beta-galactosidase